MVNPLPVNQNIFLELSREISIYIFPSIRYVVIERETRVIAEIVELGSLLDVRQD